MRTIFAMFITTLSLTSVSIAQNPLLYADLCPKKLTIEDIKKFKDNKPVRVAGVDFSPIDPEQLSAIHTKLPVSKKLFEDTNTLVNKSVEGDEVKCEFSYEKTLGRKETLTLKGVMVQ